MALWLTLLAAGAVTFATRLSFILLFERLAVPEWLRRALRYAPPAVLSAIIIPELLLQEGALNLTYQNPRLLAGLIAILVAWRTRNVLLTLLAGMGALWVLQAILG